MGGRRVKGEGNGGDKRLIYIIWIYENRIMRPNKIIKLKRWMRDDKKVV